MNRPKPGTYEAGYIWLQDGEEDGRAECGCHLIASQEGSGPAMHLCDMHSVALGMFQMLEACERIMSEAISSDPQHDWRERFADSMCGARALIKLAKVREET